MVHRGRPSDSSTGTGRNLDFKGKFLKVFKKVLNVFNFTSFKAILGVAYTYGADSVLEIQLRH